MIDEEKKWFAAYLYYAEPWENFLIDAVYPFVEMVFKNSLAEQFFFIRYWERGPHIRLRFRGHPETLENVLKSKIESFFLDYYKSHPSVRMEPEWVKELPETQKWFPTNTIQFIDYEPETERYGGTVGMRISERQFEISSRTVLSLIGESPSWDYDRSLGAAIQLHLVFAYSMGMDLHQAAQFYSFVSKAWLMSAIGYDPGLSNEELNKRKEITLSTFKEHFENQKTTLISFHSTLWNALHEKLEFEQNWLNCWLRDMSNIAGSLRQAQLSKELIIPKIIMQDQNQDIPEISSILGSYVHMTNNRLGILNRDEAYLGFLITKSLAVLYEDNKL